MCSCALCSCGHYWYYPFSNWPNVNNGHDPLYSWVIELNKDQKHISAEHYVRVKPTYDFSITQSTFSEVTMIFDHQTVFCFHFHHWFYVENLWQVLREYILFHFRDRFGRMDWETWNHRSDLTMAVMTHKKWWWWWSMFLFNSKPSCPIIQTNRDFC